MSTVYASVVALVAVRATLAFLPAHILSSPPIAVLNALSTIVGCALILSAALYLFNTLRCKIGLRNFGKRRDGKALQPPPIPYAIPWIGNSPSFLSTKPHHFWSTLFEWYPRAVGACSIVLGGRMANVLFSPVAIQHVIQDRTLGREEFNIDVVVNGLGISKEECERFYGYNTPVKEGEHPPHHEQDKINVDYLLKAEKVNELTAEFIKILKERISDQFTDRSANHEIELYKWLRTLMFDASTISLLGSKVLEVCPDLEHLFFQFDQDMLSLFFGLPGWLVSKAVSNREKAVSQLANWHKVVRDQIGTKVPDPNGMSWEPLYGSRVNRARQIFYEKRGVSIRGRAALDLGMIFGISSNAIPATNWLLMYVLESARPERQKPGERSLYSFIMDEIKASQNENGTLNISILINQPILLSALHEVLRLYVDVLVGRTITQDMALALGAHSTSKSGAPSEPTQSIQLNSGTLLMVPSYPAHTNPDVWQSVYPHHPQPDVFYPYRFLTSSPHDTTTKPVFSTAHTTGSYFPFGGGKTMCPGRNFAKQEILGALAVVLLTFEFEFIGYVDAKGNTTDKFPGLRDTLPGSAVMAASGDFKLKVKRRD
ncbi:hypothetical protein H2198_007462 [Neophaeococcomyces mojaviensis]|uniref:Uncharacterized protein n=1 Tax=Neophaeococcomyces mojaviensis TaxID=3383035 RepID=A0ACC3A095_9EURO|nr:hypothetical protein H2198_007462 [Knufia sp. JES_112]